MPRMPAWVPSLSAAPAAAPRGAPQGGQGALCGPPCGERASAAAGSPLKPAEVGVPPPPLQPAAEQPCRRGEADDNALFGSSDED